MELNSVAVYLILARLDCQEVASLADRIFAQKAIYLLQLFGIDLRYRFCWYLHGPYSKSLDSVVRSIDAEVERFAGGFSLTPEVEPALEVIRNLVTIAPSGLDRSRWLELVASIHYLKHISVSAAARADVEPELRRAGKPNFASDQIECAWQWLVSCHVSSVG